MKTCQLNGIRRSARRVGGEADVIYHPPKFRNRLPFELQCSATTHFKGFVELSSLLVGVATPRRALRQVPPSPPLLRGVGEFHSIYATKLARFSIGCALPRDS